jgi:ribosomal protein L29
MTFPENIQALRDELRQLSAKQLADLHLAMYMNMDSTMAAHYDLRAKRITEIVKLLNPSTTLS